MTFTPNYVTINFIIYSEKQLEACDIKYVIDGFKPFEGLIMSDKLKKLSIEIGETAAFFDVVGGPKRAHQCYWCCFCYFIDDWIEDMYRGKLSATVDVKDLELYIKDICKVWDTVAKTGEIDTSMVFARIKTQEDISEDYWKCMLVFLRTGRGVFESERLYRRWARSVHSYFDKYFPYEVPAVRRAVKENRYLTRDEHADHRWCSSGIPWLNAYQFTEDHIVEFFDDHDMGMVIVSQWGCLTNDALSYGKEVCSLSGDQKVTDIVVENQVNHAASKYQPFSVLKGLRDVCEEVDRQLQLCIDIHQLNPVVMRPYMKIGVFSWLNIFPYHLETSRYGWEKVDKIK